MPFKSDAKVLKLTKYFGWHLVRQTVKRSYQMSKESNYDKPVERCYNFDTFPYTLQFSPLNVILIVVVTDVVVFLLAVQQ